MESKIKTLAESGLCEKESKNILVFYEVIGGAVVRVSCKHETCRWRSRCELYQKHPIGSIVD